MKRNNISNKLTAASFSIESALIVPFIITIIFSLIILGFNTRQTFFNNADDYSSTYEALCERTESINDSILLYHSILTSINILKTKEETK